MKVILSEDVKNLGLMGEVVNVSDGYARNFLFPKKFAVEANTKNLKEFEHNKKVGDALRGRKQADWVVREKSVRVKEWWIKKKAGLL